ncbi:MAG TPA: hypothetical protein VNC22_22205, partial [Sporichthya sp.]|nr:hypothetical protein [Sporichthya sp.]
MTAVLPDSGTRVVQASCPHDCPDGCAMQVTVVDGRATEVRGDPDHPFTKGGL